MPDLPTPATTDQEYLAAVLGQLRALNDHFGGGRAEPDQAGAPAAALPRDGTVPIEEPDRPEVNIRHKGAGYYVLSVNGEDVDQVRGQEAAEARAEELRSGDG